jgi:TetR/AcrR family transcriptional repressor of nem operon
MRVSPEVHRAHGTAILKSAAALFRARGLSDVSVADVTAAAGLTHGAFYGHFASKAVLAEAACRDTLEAGAALWRARTEAARAAGGSGLTAIIEAYLTVRHRDEPQTGCALVTLGSEFVRGGDDQRQALSDGATALLAVLEDEIALARPAADAAARRAAAAGVLAALAGGLLLARALTDPAASDAALAAAARAAHAAAQI